jgi:hypothetical protein
VGALVMAAELFVCATQASEVLGLAVLTRAVEGLGLLFGRVLAAALVLAVGLWVASLAGAAIEGAAPANARVLARIARGAILFFAGALALLQAGLPKEIVTLAFGAAVGAVGLGVALAIGLGGRRVAGNLLEQAVASFKPSDKAVPPPEEPR